MTTSRSPHAASFTVVLVAAFAACTSGTTFTDQGPPMGSDSDDSTDPPDDSLVPPAGDSLGLATRDDLNQPIDVGLLILGHSTSQQGDWPGKLARALNANVDDGRNYVVFRAITPGDGGSLWTQLSFEPGDEQYARVLASAGNQSFEDAVDHRRWSKRRLLLERSLGQTVNAPPAADVVQPAAIPSCVWHDADGAHDEALDFLSCWHHMDTRLALIQDTSNRSFPVDEVTGDGLVDNQDYFPAASIRAGAAPCESSAGVIDGSIDVDCDGQLTPADAARNAYASWLATLATDLLGAFGAASVDHVFFSHKPVEFAADADFDGETFDYYTPRAPTARRPFDRFYLPSVFWEHKALETLFARPDLDARIHPATPGNVLAMWERSAHCYTDGIAAHQWTIPLDVGRPESIAADDSESPETAEAIGCMRHDHVHHNDSGGWMMADVWYAGLHSYLVGSTTH